MPTEIWDREKYCWASHLPRIVDWNIHVPKNIWIVIEQCFSSYPIGQLPWTISALHIPTIASHPLVSAYLKVLWQVSKCSGSTDIHSPLTPIRQNPEFIPGMSSTFLVSQWPSTPSKAKDFFAEELFRDRDNRPKSVEGWPVSFWIYFQIQHFLYAGPLRTSFSSPLTHFESLCGSSSPIRHLISTLYSLFFVDCKAN